MTFSPTSNRALRSRGKHAFTLAEVVISVLLAAITIAAVMVGYSQSAGRAEWSGLSYAAQALAIQRIEQVRSAKWDTEAGVDEVVSTNFPPQVTVMDLPISGTNVVFATNFTTITTLSATPPLLKMIRVDCVWRFQLRARLYTNTLVTYRAPDV